MQRFLDTEDISCLEKPLLFENNESHFKKLQCCQAALLTAGTFCLSVPFVPMASCCPYSYADQFSLRLERDSVTFQSANNDCCCHVAKTLKTLPMDKIQDVELQSNCLLTCFGLKAVNIQTAGQGGTSTAWTGSGPMGPEVSAAFLRSPEKVREAIRLAVKLYRQQGTQAGTSTGGYAAPRAPVPAWGEVSAAGPKGSSLVQRLQDLEGLVTHGVLTRAEADGLKVCVLAAPNESWLSRLGEAADLRDRGLITPEEFGQLKASLITQLRTAAA